MPHAPVYPLYRGIKIHFYLSIIGEHRVFPEVRNVYIDVLPDIGDSGLAGQALSVLELAPAEQASFGSCHCGQRV
ncbi:hypothetical protein ES708_19098 [subsurface metagenome]